MRCSTARNRCQPVVRVVCNEDNLQQDFGNDGRPAWRPGGPVRQGFPHLRGRTDRCVGIGCRFPGGVVGPDDYWSLLAGGRDAITEVPADRWDAEEYYDPDPLAPGRMPSKWGGFISDVSGFDADFFGITPREAEAMDPQQRVLLEVAWEALEHAEWRPTASAEAGRA